MEKETITASISPRAYTRVGAYLRVGKFLHISFLICLFMAWTDYQEWKAGDGGQFWMMIWWIYLSIFPLLDGRSRFQNYKKLKDQLYDYGFQSKLLKPFMISRCQREAAMVAAKELGMGKRLKEFINQKGYRWYHFVPDFVWSHPFFWLSPKFWTFTFFAPRYRPHHNYREIARQTYVRAVIASSEPDQVVQQKKSA